MKNDTYQTVDEYIARSDDAIRPTLSHIRALIKQIAPEAVEHIAYGMPAYKVHGKPLVYFAAFPNHIGLYATPKGHEAFKEQLSAYKGGKGSVQFPRHDVPYDLIAEIITFKLSTL